MTNPGVEQVEIVSKAAGDQPHLLVPTCRTLDRFAFECGAEGVTIEPLETGTTLVVQTLYSHYRVVVVDGLRHLVLVQGGKMFREAAIVRLEGATAGGSALKMGWIIVGLRIEMSLGQLRIKSSRVRSVAIEGVPSLCHSHSRVA